MKNRFRRQSNLMLSHRRKRHFLGELFSIGSSLLGGMGSSSAGAATAASAAAMIEAAAQIEEKTDEYRKIVRKDGKRYRKRVNRALASVTGLAPYEDLDFNRARGISSFLEESKALSTAAFDSMTSQKRSNMDFSLGGATEGLRTAQTDFSKLAAGDTSGFNQIVKASAFGAIAENAGLPLGAFANTSAKNMMDFRRLGTEASMGISDFFAKQGTVDPINPLDSIFKLAGFERDENVRSKELDMFNRNLSFELEKFNRQTQLAKTEMKIGSEDSIFQTFANMEAHALDTYADAYKFAAGAGGGQELGAATAQGGMGQALGQIGNTISEGGLFGGLFG